MKATYVPVQTVAYCYVEKKLTNVDDLTPVQQVQLATELKKQWLNGLFQGKAHFTEASFVEESPKE